MSAPTAGGQQSGGRCAQTWHRGRGSFLLPFLPSCLCCEGWRRGWRRPWAALRAEWETGSGLGQSGVAASWASCLSSSVRPASSQHPFRGEQEVAPSTSFEILLVLVHRACCLLRGASGRRGPEALLGRTPGCLSGSWGVRAGRSPGLAECRACSAGPVKPSRLSICPRNPGSSLPSSVHIKPELAASRWKVCCWAWLLNQ